MYIHVYVCVFVKLNDAINLYTYIVPDVPQSLEVVTVTSTSVTLQWMPPTYPNGIITHYSIHCDGMACGDFGNDVSDKMMSVIEGLSPDTDYVFEMKAYTRVGSGPSVSIPVKTRKFLK